MPSETQPVTAVHQKKRHFFLMKMSTATLTAVSYAAVRGKDQEQGSVQRILNPRRISSLREFALNGGDYATSVVLNWVSADAPLVFNHEKTQVDIPIVSRAAQIIDGQHRVEGLREAMKTDSSIGEVPIPVAVYVGL